VAENNAAGSSSELKTLRHTHCSETPAAMVSNHDLQAASPSQAASATLQVGLRGRYY